MTRYYFDTYEEGSFIQDEVGVELDGAEAACREAAAALPDIARDATATGNRTVTLFVREEDGGPFYKATLTLSFDRLGEPSPYHLAPASLADGCVLMA